jgi:hypothetical protein
LVALVSRIGMPTAHHRLFDQAVLLQDADRPPALACVALIGRIAD